MLAELFLLFFVAVFLDNYFMLVYINEEDVAVVDAWRKDPAHYVQI